MPGAGERGGTEGQQPPEIGGGSPPGPASRELAARLGAVESRGVTYLAEDFPVFWTRARGVNVWDADGNRYVDLTAGFAVAGPGHRHPVVEAAVRRQAGRLMHGMGDVHPPGVKVELLERLSALSPYREPRILLGISGGDAVEAALKTATLHTGRPGVVAFTGAYHGLGYGALAVTDGAHFRAPFAEQLNPHVLRAGYPHPYRPPARLRGSRDPGALSPSAVLDASLADLEGLLGTEEGRRVGAVIVEPIQGRGGEVVPPDGFLPRLARLCEERELLLIADEIYTGLGRAGSWFGSVGGDVVPDLICVGKALSGGMPISACVGSREVMDAWAPSHGEAVHTSTFLGHPVACAAAVASLGVLEEEALPERSRELGARWRTELRTLATDHACVGDVRGRGLMIGLDLVVEDGGRTPDPDLAGRVVLEALRRGWLLLAGGPEGNVISLSPPLTISAGLLRRATGMLDDALSAAGRSA